MSNMIYEELELLDQIDPISSSTANAGAWVSVRDHEQILALVSVGAIAATGTVDITLTQATDSSGTGAKALLAAAQLTDADDNKTVALAVRASQLDVDNDFNHVLLTITCATAASIISGLVLGAHANEQPVPTTAFDELVIS